MKEKEFRKLLNKAIHGTLNNHEKMLIETYQKKMLVLANKKQDFKKNNSSIKDTLWNDIQNNIKPKTKVLTIVSSVAAILIVALVLSQVIFYSDKTPTVDPAKVITLKLDDGTIKVLNENTNTTIKSNLGNTVVTQQKTKLQYNNTKAKIETLVYNTLTIPYGKKFEVVLSDGTTAFLNSGSSLKYPVHFIKGKERKVFVDGEVFFDVAKNPKSAFIVNAKALNVKVYGTKFNVQAYTEDTQTEVVLVEGSVGLYTGHKVVNDKDVKRLKPGYKATFNKQNKAIVNSKVNTSIYTSWMDGELVFRDMTFHNILKKLERHYNVEIINNNTSISFDKFNASFGKNPPIHVVLQEIKQNYNIDYTITEHKIIIN
ncbi:DUF4974 domain-containing protein [Seonamhaeicola algicola]|uniref:DUF4974 domain-containing protein n=1 Tax=Seonamhaeicola algicola TaxID=1719036 RepID=A0A5C7AY59_9FLAO|nr:FecR family protein [Seonamhaeicola algicola]TXE13097.1 DUF4974 domain-containing protein [Seonamhaeicola algicola]